MISRSHWILYGSLTALVVGLTVGSYFPDLFSPLEFIPKIFINGLKLILVPLIVTSVISSVAALSKSLKSAGVLFRTFGYFLATTALAVTTGILLALIIPSISGSGQQFVGAPVPLELQTIAEQHASTFLDDLIPSSVPEAILNGNYAAIILVSIILAVALSLVGRSSKIIFDINQAVYDLIFKLADFMMVASPVAVLVISASAVSDSSGNFMSSLAGMKIFMLIFISGLLIHALFTLPLILKSMARQNPISFFKGLLPSLISGFSVSSATTNLPLTSESLIINCKSNKYSAGIVLPLGSVFNLNSTAMFAAIAAIVAANLFQIEISFLQILLIWLSAIIGSFALAGMPFSSLILTTAIFSIVDFPNVVMGIIGALFLLEWINDRFRTVVNIFSDAVGSAVISEFIAPQVMKLKTTDRSYQRNRDDRGSREGGRESRDGRSRSSRTSSGSYKGRQTRPDRSSSPSADREERTSRSFSERKQTATRTDSRFKKDDRSPRSPRPEHPSRQAKKPMETSPFEIYSKENQPLDLETPLPAKPAPRKVTPRPSKPATERKIVVARKLPAVKRVTTPSISTNKPTIESKPVPPKPPSSTSKPISEPTKPAPKVETKVEPRVEAKTEIKKESSFEPKSDPKPESTKTKIQFGRGKKRSSSAGTTPVKSSDKPDSEPKAEKEENSAIAAKQTFGRGRKKRA